MRVVFAPVLLLVVHFFGSSTALAMTGPESTPVRPAAPCRKDGKGSSFLVHFDRVELHELVQTAADATCRTFVLPDKLQGKVSLIGPEQGQGQLNAEAFYAAFLAALDGHNLTVTGNGPYLRIVEKSRAVRTDIPTYVDGDAPSPLDERVVTRVFRLEHLEPEPVKQLFSQLTPDGGAGVLVFPPDTLVVTDTGPNLHRLERLLARLDADKGVTEQLRVFTLRHASVRDVAEKLQRGLEVTKRRTASGPGSVASGTQGGTGSSATPFLADERTNKLLVLGTSSLFERVEALLAELDVALPGSEEVRVYPLENADAKELAASLTELVGGTRSAGSRPSGVGGPPAPVTLPGLGSGGGGATFDGEVRITAHESKNALLIVASPGDFRQLVQVIEALDTPQRQVLIETVIMEVSVERGSKVGVAGHGLGAVGQGEGRSPLVLGSTPSGGPTSLDLRTLAGAEGLVLGLQGPLHRELAKVLGLASLSQFGIVLQALQSNSDVNVLSMPHILTTDNHEAVINVGQKVPFATGLSPAALAPLLGAAGGAGSASAVAAAVTAPQITRERVELKLTVKPHIGEGGHVRLELDQQTEELVGGNNKLGPVTSTRGEKTRVVARDGETVMLGGILQERLVELTSKVPVLGDLPLLGRLFRYSDTTKMKTNLLVFLTPHVIHTPADLRRLSERKLRERQVLVEQFYGELPGLEAVVDVKSRPGPLSSMARTVLRELRRPERGGPGNPDEKVIRPAAP